MEIFESVPKVFDLVGKSPTSVLLSVIGVLLIVLATVLAYRATSLRPEDISSGAKIILIGSIACGVLFSVAGPAFTLLQVQENVVPRIPREKALNNLAQNENISWLIRLIPFDPKKNPELSINTLPRLGPPEQLYTFVGPYEELRGYRVSEAVRRLGGTLRPGQHVSAIIFPIRALGDDVVYPANGRGLLQVIDEIENKEGTKIDVPFLKGKGRINEKELEELRKDRHLESWRFENYNYGRFCELTFDFRCNKQYSARDYIGEINRDWHPIGSAQREGSDPCKSDSRTYCANSSDWGKLKSSIYSKFGSRIFLVRNYTISDLNGRHLIDFGDPDEDLIPDIGLRPTP